VVQEHKKTDSVTSGAPQRKSKLISLAEAGKIVAGCKTISMSGSHSANAPMALIREAIRAGASELTVIPPITVSIGCDLLIAAGCVHTFYICYIGFEFLGLAPAFKKAAEAQSINTVEVDEPFIVLGMRAGAGNWPFVPVYPEVYEGVDIPSLNPLMRTVKDPYTGKEVITIPPLKSDVFIAHVQQADEYGNSQCWGGTAQERDRAKAASKVIVTTDELVPLEKTRKNPDGVTIPGYLVDAVIYVPFGAHPTASSGCYGYDDSHLKLYRDLVGSGREKEYLSRFVFEPKDYYEYLGLIGLERLFELRRLT
jgi:glutaconate CoA-transferase subunit A